MDNKNLNINFGAKYIKTKEVLRLAENNNYVSHPANIIEMNHSCEQDLNAIQELYDYWPNATYINPIMTKKDCDGRRVFALTTQETDFSNPESKKILGIADLYLRGEDAYLRFLQADSNLLHNTQRSYKHVGQALMQGVVDYLSENNIKFLKLCSRQDTKPFYKKVFPAIVEESGSKENFYNMVLDLKHKDSSFSIEKESSADPYIHGYINFFG